MFLIYQIVLFMILLLGWPYLVLRAVAGGHGLKERLGIWNFVPDGRKVVWFHASSVGELKVIATVLPELLERRDNLRVIITTVTKTGQEKAAQFALPVEIYYLPIDLAYVLNRVIQRVRPALIVLVETELWPGLIKQSRQAGTRVAIVNGRISSRSFMLYDLFKPLFLQVLQKVDIIMAQTGGDAHRFIQMGAEPPKVSVYGNTKFDQVLVQNPNETAEELVDFLKDDSKFVFIAGSVRAREIEAVVEAIASASSAKAVIAPRHLKDLGALENKLRWVGLDYVKRSQLSTGIANRCRVAVLDTMGELGGLYRYADLAFVGGSLAPLGGHDPLEPAAGGCAVCFGPHMDNCRSLADLLLESGGASQVSSGQDLGQLINRLAADRSLAAEYGQKVHQAVLSRSGVSLKIAEKLTEFI